MTKNNNIYYATISNQENGYGNQYRIIKENEEFKIQVLTPINNQYIWKQINIDSNINLNTLNDTFDYINENIESNSNALTKKKALTKPKKSSKLF